MGDKINRGCLIPGSWDYWYSSWLLFTHMKIVIAGSDYCILLPHAYGSLMTVIVYRSHSIFLTMVYKNLKCFQPKEMLRWFMIVHDSSHWSKSWCFNYLVMVKNMSKLLTMAYNRRKRSNMIEAGFMTWLLFLNQLAVSGLPHQSRFHLVELV